MRLLQEHGIPSSQATRAWVEREARNPSPTNSPVSVGSEWGSMNGEDGGGENNNNSNHPGTNISTTLERAFENLNLSSSTRNAFSPPSSANRRSSHVSFTFSPAAKTMSGGASNSPPAPPTNSFLQMFGGNGTTTTNNATNTVPHTPPHDDSSTTPSAASSRGSSSGYHAVVGLPGSKSNPNVILVDLAHPENHGRFDVKRNPRIVRHGVSRESIHIKTAIGCKDVDKWHAFMDLPDVDHKYRSFTIQGPARDSHYKDATDRPCDGDDTAIFGADQKADREIENDPNRNTKFHKFILPKGFELDNMFLSHHHHNINSNVFGTSTTEDGTPFNVVFIEWEIARLEEGTEVGTRKTRANGNGAGLKALFRK